MTYRIHHKIKGHANRISAVRLLGQTQFLTASWDGTVKLWDLRSGDLVYRFDGQARLYEDLSPGPIKGQFLAVADDSSIDILDLQKGKCLQQLNTNCMNASGWALSMDGKYILQRYEKEKKLRTRVIDLTDYKEIMDGPIELFTFLEEGPNKHHAYGKRVNWDGDFEEWAIIGIWDVETGKLAKKLKKAWVNVHGITPDGKFTLEEGFRLRDIRTGKIVRSLEDPPNHVPPKLYFTPDGSHLILPNRGAMNEGIGLNAEHTRRYQFNKPRYFDIMIWDLATGKCTPLISATSRGHTDYVTDVGISDDSRSFITGSADGTVKIWERGGRRVKETITVLDTHTDTIESIDVSKDLSTIICGTLQGTIFIFTRHSPSAAASMMPLSEEEIEERGKELFFRTATKDDLKQVCREYKISGYSKLKKGELVSFVLNSLSEEELEEIIADKATWINKRINEAFFIISETHRAEHFETFYAVNPQQGRYEMPFVRYNNSEHAYFGIPQGKINEVEFECECSLGASGGLCAHFWIGFIFGLLEQYFSLDQWKLVPLPSDFEARLRGVEVTRKKKGKTLVVKLQKKTAATGKSVTKSQENFPLSPFVGNRITVYEGEVSHVEQKSYSYGGEDVEYALLTLKNAKVGPQVKRKKDYDVDTIKTMDGIVVRLSERLYTSVNPSKGDAITFNGRVVDERFQGIYIKRVMKVSKLS